MGYEQLSFWSLDEARRIGGVTASQEEHLVGRIRPSSFNQAPGSFEQAVQEPTVALLFC